MKFKDLCSKYGRKKMKNLYTQEEVKEEYVAANLFRALDAEQKSSLQIWSMDFTEQKPNGEKVYTCGIIDINDKVVKGFETSSSANRVLACKSVESAIAQYGVPDMIMTDRGSPFVSKDFQKLLEKHNIRHSMSRPHTPVDNVFIETFWKSMKTEIGKVDQWTEAQYLMVVNYYVDYYNNLRPHSSLGYRPPLQAA